MITDSDIEPQHPDEPTVDLDHVVLENDELPDECAIVPAASSDIDHVASWIVAHDASFVSLLEMC